MNTTILAPAFYKSWDKVKYIKQSAEHWNVPITLYGFDEPYKGWHYVQIDRLIEEIAKVQTEWVIYTDSSDAIINGPVPDIEPWNNIIASVESDGQICAGGWLGRKEEVYQKLVSLKDFHPCKACGPDTMNPQIKWRCQYHWRYDHGLDKFNEIFQVADVPLEIKEGRLYNPSTNTFPFIVHWAGGYTDPDVGKAALIEPTWKKLNY